MSPPPAMAREYSRRERVGDYLQRELALLIQRELRDPRVGMVSVTAVDVSRDLAHARIYFTLLGCDTAEDAEPAARVLNGAAGFLRSALARNAPMRTVPRMRFFFDTSVGRGRDLEALIERASAADARHHEAREDDEAPAGEAGEGPGRASGAGRPGDGD